MCQINQHEGIVSFAAIRRVLRELFVKKHEGVHAAPPTSARVKMERSQNSPDLRSQIAKFRDTYFIDTVTHNNR